MIKKYLRKIYQRFPFLRKIKTAIWRLKDKVDIKKYLPTSSAQNKLALDHLTKRRFNYTEDYFSQLGGFDHNTTLPYIDISIVTYNSSKWIEQFIGSLNEQVYPLDHINLYFVDNGSKDDTVKRLETIKEKSLNQFQSFSIIQQGNLGFGAGHDRAIQASQSQFVLITNIDLIFEKSSILNAVKTALSDTDEHYASWEFRQIPYEHPKYYDPITLETNWSSHACILIRRSAYTKAGGYEPKIFMYAEDVELSYRFRAYGYHLKYCPNAIVHHFTYEHENQVKPIQFAGSTLGNAYVRLRYGNTIDKLAIIPLYLALLLQKERFEGSRKIVLKNIAKIVKNKYYFSKFIPPNQDLHAPFREFDYELIRDGAFYAIELPVITPLVTIVVRTYQGRDTLLKQCLISILNQTYSNIEIIIVEDGGDTMRSVVEPLLSTANIHYYSQPKVGRSATGNFGLASAKGIYCLFLDDDDLIFADHIETLVATLQKSPQASASYALAYEVPTHMDADKKYYTEEDLRTLGLFYQPFSYEELTDHNYFPIQCVLFKKELFLERGGIDETLTYLEDWNLWLRYAYNNEFIYVPKTTSLYRIPAHNDVRHERHAQLHQAYNDAKEKAMRSIKECIL